MIGEYTVERRGNIYYMYNEFGAQMPDKSAFASDTKAVRKLYQEAARLNRELDDEDR